MERFGKIVNKPFNIFVKRSILDVWQGSEYASVSYNANHIATYKGRPSFKEDVTKSINKVQSNSCAYAVCRRAAAEEIDQFE